MVAMLSKPFLHPVKSLFPALCPVSLRNFISVFMHAKGEEKYIQGVPEVVHHILIFRAPSHFAICVQNSCSVMIMINKIYNYIYHYENLHVA